MADTTTSNATSPGLVSNFELGGAALLDWGLGTHLAASVYTAQTALPPGQTVEAVQATVAAAEDQGAQRAAADATAVQVQASAMSAADALKASAEAQANLVRWLVVGAVAVAVIVVFVYLGPVVAGLAPKRA